MFTITIESLLCFHEYFDNKMISMKNFPLDFEKGLIYSYIFWLLCTNVERLGRKKIMQIFSAILNLVTWPESV